MEPTVKRLDDTHVMIGDQVYKFLICGMCGTYTKAQRKPYMKRYRTKIKNNKYN